MSGEPDPGGDPTLALDVAASGLRVDTTDVHALVEALAARLQGALPALVQVHRRRVGGLFSKRSEVDRIEVALGDERYVLARAATGFHCTRHRVVRGITLKREEIAMNEYVTAVVAGVTRMAEVKESDRLALMGLLG